MPRGDGTGPQGQGPMTGRGMGYCAGYPAPGFMNPGIGGRGRGMGRGMGWRRNAPPMYFSPMTPKEEKSMLSQEVKALEEQMKAIQQRLSELKDQK